MIYVGDVCKKWKKVLDIYGIYCEFFFLQIRVTTMIRMIAKNIAHNFWDPFVGRMDKPLAIYVKWK